ncbi:MAG: MlaC/ttg2D family ABC transporter substrate-binding protein [Candidatus Binatia bacterium]
MTQVTASTIRIPSRRAELALAALLCVAGTAHGAAGDAPRAVVQRLADQVLVILRDKQLSSDAKRSRIETVVYANVDFDTLSQLVLARYWSRFTPAEQARFTSEFKRHLSVTYGKSVDNYRNEQVDIMSDREEARGDWTVKTKILRGGPDDILVNYRLRQVDGEWRIIDFVVEGVSLVANFRSQFQDLLASKSPGELIQLIHEKNEKGESFEKGGAQRS